jgi:TetR/AcrR family transcriptional regulator, transcriptional repressor for nem operon
MQISEKRSDRAARRPHRRSRDPEASRRALVDAAAELFNSVGYYGTDTNRIAVAAGYTPGTFYTHFEDKRAIFLEVYRQWVNAEIVAVAAVLKSNEPSKRLRLARVVLEHHRKWKIFRASLRALYATDAVVHAAWLEQRRRQIEVALGQKHRSGKQARAEILATLLTTEALCDAMADGDVEALDVKEAEMFKVLMDSI